ncbi:MAG: ABC transporter ATP-binding protein [Paludibacteraceae bacterium]|nr:ABC transporter ATP-binding protein [Paludibacteraceae bacterium]
MATAIEFNHVGKQYRLGLVSTGTISHDLNRWWQTAILRKEDPYLKIGSVNDRTQKADSDYVWALRDIDFKVEQGDVVGIIGKNGAGKSTLLKLLSKVTGPTVGSIRARGRIASLLEVGTGFHQEMTGRENIFMNGAILGMTKAEIAAKLDEIVDFSGCERYLDTPVKRYSSGMMVRLGFAVAAHLDPEILVVDEVLAVGDAEFQKKAIGKMQDVSKGEGRTVLFVSHNMQSIRNLCHRGVVLDKGCMAFDGFIEDAVNYYLEEQSSVQECIVSNITSKAYYIDVNRVEINGQSTNPIKLSDGNNHLHVVFEGNLKTTEHIAFEMRLMDQHATPLLFYAPSHQLGSSLVLPTGPFCLEYDLDLPSNMTAGTYFLTLELTDPGNVYHLKMERAVQIDCAGKTTSTGQVFNYDNGIGFIFMS